MSMSVKDAVSAMSNFANGLFRKDVTEFVQGMDREHRTLQQCFTGVCLAWLNHLANTPEGHYDQRNEASIKIARRIKNAVPEIEWGVPFI